MIDLTNSGTHCEDVYRNVFEGMCDPILLLKDGHFIDCNNATLSFLGYAAKSEFLNHNRPGEISPPCQPDGQSSEEKAAEMIAIALQDGFHRFEWVHLRSDGSHVLVEVSLTAITANGEVILHTLWRDLAERKQAEEILKASEAHYRLMTENVSDVAWRVDSNYRFTYISPADERLRGFKADEVIGHHVFEMFDEEGIESIKKLAQRRQEAALAGIDLGTTTFEAQHRCKDGSWLWAEINSRPEYDSNGMIIGYYGITREITERKQAHKALQESEERFRSLMENIPAIAVQGYTRDGTVFFWNRASEQLYGYSAEEAKGANLLDLIVPPEMKEGMIEAIRLMQVSGVPIPAGELLLKRKDGSRVPVISSRALVDPVGRSQELFCIDIDLTDRKEHEKELLKIEKLESLGVLAGGIAHDFNNILTGIMGNISFAQMFLDATHKSYKPLVEAEKASVRASELAHQLLTFARGGEPVKNTVSLRNLVNETVTLVLRGSNVKGIVTIPESLHAIDADEGQLSQVFHNIIINAAQAMPGGGVLTVTAENETLEENNSMSLSPGCYVCVSFSDQGCGISDVNIKKIFDPYYTTKLSGNGLGLASANSILTRHGGYIGVKSEVGKGTAFTIHLPSTGQIFSSHQVDIDADVGDEHRGGSILVMDDEKIIRDMTSEMLAFLGYSVAVCEDGSEAIELFTKARERGTPFSAVIFDLTVPGGMGGKDAAARILAIDPDTCIIVSSGYSNDPIMSDFRMYGFSGAVAKPYTINEFGNLLRSLVFTCSSGPA